MLRLLVQNESFLPAIISREEGNRE